MANLSDRVLFRYFLFFYSKNVQNIEASRINLFCPTGYSREYTRRLHFDTVNIVSSGAVDYWKNNETGHSLKVAVKISCVSFLSEK